MFAHESAETIRKAMLPCQQDDEWQAALASSPSLRCLVLANGEEQIYMAWRLGHTAGQLKYAMKARAA